MGKRGYLVVQDNGKPDYTNRFEDEAIGYKDIALKFIKGENDPIIRELQLIQSAMFDAKMNEGHILYDKQKDIKDKLQNSKDLSANEIAKLKDEYQDIDRRMAKLYESAYLADSASNTLPNFLPSDTSEPNAFSPNGSPVLASKPDKNSAKEEVLAVLDKYLSALRLSSTERAAKFLADSSDNLVITSSPDTSSIAEAGTEKQEKNTPPATGEEVEKSEYEKIPPEIVDRWQILTPQQKEVITGALGNKHSMLAGIRFYNDLEKGNERGGAIGVLYQDGETAPDEAPKLSKPIIINQAGDSSGEQSEKMMGGEWRTIGLSDIKNLLQYAPEKVTTEENGEQENDEQSGQTSASGDSRGGKTPRTSGNVSPGAQSDGVLADADTGVSGESGSSGKRRGADSSGRILQDVSPASDGRRSKTTRSQTDSGLGSDISAETGNDVGATSEKPMP